jgi:hypothetical protein
MPPSRQPTPVLRVDLGSKSLYSLSTADSHVSIATEPGLTILFHPPEETTLASPKLFGAADSFSLTIQNP